MRDSSLVKGKRQCERPCWTRGLQSHGWGLAPDALSWSPACLPVDANGAFKGGFITSGKAEEGGEERE